MPGRRILLADGDSFIQIAVQCAAAIEELEVVSATDAATVTTLAAESQPDLIVLELKFQDANGLDVLWRLKADPRTMGVPVLMWSASEPSTYQPAATELGAVDCVLKTDASALLTKIKSMLRQGHDEPAVRLASLASWLPSARESRPPSSPSSTDGALQVLKDSEGSLEIGWLATRVLYSRLTGSFSAQLGALFTLRLSTLVLSVPEVEYFVDARALRDFDPLARSTFARAVLGSRAKFAVLDVLAWSTSGRHERETLQALLGKPSRILMDAAEFENRLFAAAPRAHSVLLGRGQG